MEGLPAGTVARKDYRTRCEIPGVSVDRIIQSSSVTVGQVVAE